MQRKFWNLNQTILEKKWKNLDFWTTICMKSRNSFQKIGQCFWTIMIWNLRFLSIQISERSLFLQIIWEKQTKKSKFYTHDSISTEIFFLHQISKSRKNTKKSKFRAKFWCVWVLGGLETMTAKMFQLIWSRRYKKKTLQKGDEKHIKV